MAKAFVVASLKRLDVAIATTNDEMAEAWQAVGDLAVAKAPDDDVRAAIAQATHMGGHYAGLRHARELLTQARK